jgi:hypothetical protein
MDPHLKPSDRVEFLFALVFPRGSEVAHSAFAKLAREWYLQFDL